jgi:uncharacterized protein (TIGR03437 family)
MSLAAQIPTPPCPVQNAATGLIGTLRNAHPEATIPCITGVASSASGQSVAVDVPGHIGAAPGSWITIYGTNFTVLTRGWSDPDFVNGQLPPQMDYVSVTVNGRPTVISYISPTQLNVLLPDVLPNENPLALRVMIQLLQSNFFYIQKAPLQPVLFQFAPRYPAAVHNANGVYAGPAGLLQGVTTAPAKPGEVIQLYGTGFGASNPAAPAGVLFYGAYPLAQTVTATVGGQSATVTGYIVAPGVYQFNITVPNVADGDQALLLTTAGIGTQPGLFLAVQH